MTLDQLQRLLDSHFGEPFLSAGMVRTKMRDRDGGPRSLSIYIGRRDVDVTEDGTVLGAGTCLATMPPCAEGAPEPTMPVVG